MAYATPADLMRYFGAPELAQRGAPDADAVTADLMAATINATDRSAYDAAAITAADEALAKLVQVLDDASGMMDTYLGVRYTVPVYNAVDQLRRPCADLARCALYSSGIPKDLQERCDNIIAWLQRIADGKASLSSEWDSDESGRLLSIPLVRVS